VRDRAWRSGLGGGLIAGLADARVQAEIADQLVRRAEPGEVTDRGGDRHGDCHVDAGDRHQPLGVLTAQRDPRELGVDEPQLVGVEVQPSCPDRPPVVPP
jgi:hypothetical protein